VAAGQRNADSHTNVYALANPDSNAEPYANPNTKSNSYANAHSRAEWNLRRTLANWNLNHRWGDPLVWWTQLEGNSGRISDRRWLATA